MRRCRDLDIKIIPRREWARITWLLKDHGRAVCKAPEPLCADCPLEHLCPERGVKRKQT